MVWAAAIPAIAGAVKMGAGALLASTAKKPIAPTYTIPQEYQDTLARAKRRVAEGMPFADKLYSQAATSQATAIGAVERGATSSQDVLGMTSQIQAQTMQDLNKIQQSQVAYQMDAEGRLASAESQMGAARGQEFASKMQDYQQKYSDYKSQMSQGFQGIFSGAADIGSYFGSQANVNLYKKGLKDMNTGGSSSSYSPSGFTPYTINPITKRPL